MSTYGYSKANLARFCFTLLRVQGAAHRVHNWRPHGKCELFTSDFTTREQRFPAQLKLGATNRTHAPPHAPRTTVTMHGHDAAAGT